MLWNNCPKCGYPDKGGYKGTYSESSPCDGCGFSEKNSEILEALKQVKEASSLLDMAKQNLKTAIDRAYNK